MYLNYKQEKAHLQFLCMQVLLKYKQHTSVQDSSASLNFSMVLQLHVADKVKGQIKHLGILS